MRRPFLDWIPGHRRKCGARDDVLGFRHHVHHDIREHVRMQLDRDRELADVLDRAVRHANFRFLHLQAELASGALDRGAAIARRCCAAVRRGAGRRERARRGENIPSS